MPNTQQLRQQLRESIRTDEASLVQLLADNANLDRPAREAISHATEKLVVAIRGHSDPQLMESFLTEYGLTSKEGIALMCLAEALLRVPDHDTVDKLIHDKIVPANWGRHLGQSSSSLVNASTWALMLTGRIIDEEPEGVVGTVQALVRKLGEPVIRTAVNQAIRELGNQFVLGETIDDAAATAAKAEARGYTYSYDMLGEAARTEKDAKRYHLAYSSAISSLGKLCVHDSVAENPGISVKLSALYPRYEVTQRDDVLIELTARTRSLAMLAKSANMGFNIDAEEADRLDLSLDVIEAVLQEPSLAGWDGFGIVVQAYSRRASFLIDWLYDLSARVERRLMVRLVKGAYWDTEIKLAQVEGLDDFPVFTRKAHTDISYLACARQLLRMTDRLYPQFATHNAHSVAAILHMAEARDSFEFQRLHGMGDALHDIVMQQHGTRCRIYAPVGAHEDLLAYLVRRLLENGANSSFVNQLVDEQIPPSDIAADPFAAIDTGASPNPAIRQPQHLFGTSRPNSRGLDLTDPLVLQDLQQQRQHWHTHQWSARPTSNDGNSGGNTNANTGTATAIRNPANPEDLVGHCDEADPAQVEAAIATASQAAALWQRRDAAFRADLLRAVADQFELHRVELMSLACREAGKTLPDAVAEIREAVDFLRYYANDAEALAQNGTYTARGIFVCISPWNFPLAIFTGQIAAALVTGNTVLAKPAQQTPLIAARAIELFHAAGLTTDVLQLLPGDGPTVGAALTADARIAGVCFTGSTATAQRINQNLAEHCDPDTVLIAETGGLNAMLVDSTALPEQAIGDIIDSAFQSAGQRCSALRMLYVQEDIFDRFVEMLTGAMALLKAGDPWLLQTDLGPVIDADARQAIAEYCDKLQAQGKLLYQCAVDDSSNGHFIAPALYRVAGIEELPGEIFGPVLHIASYSASDFDNVLDAINRSGYALTFGLHTRVDERVQDVTERIEAGNVYINRNQIGAIVGSQPFGGKALSGTGPKAGGPHYLLRFCDIAAEHKLPPTASTQTTANATTKGATLAASSIEQAIATVGSMLTSSTVADLDTDLDKHIKPFAETLDSALLISAEAAADGSPWRRHLELALANARTHYHDTIDLPGPTGESNRLGMEGAGTVLCVEGEDTLHWVSSIVLAALFGNQVVAISAVPERGVAIADSLSALFPANTPPTLAVMPAMLSLDIDTLRSSTDDIHAVCTDASHPQLRELRVALSQRRGPIVPLVTSLFDITPLIAEKALCIDTTAAGGNATLLAQAES